MTTVEHFKSYVALVIEKVTLEHLNRTAATEGKPLQNTYARLRTVCAEADRMLMNWFTTPDDLETVSQAMRLDYELAVSGNASEQEERLAFCRRKVATLCLDLKIPDFSDEDCDNDPAYQATCLRQENRVVICEIYRFIRYDYLGYPLSETVW